MKNHGFEYYMNAVHYCIYKGEVRSNLKVEKQVYKTSELLSALFFLKNKFKARVEQLHNDNELQDYLYGKETGMSIGMAHHWFGFFYSAYAAFFSWVLVGIADRTFGDFNQIRSWLLFGIPIGICYIPAYKALYSGEKYLKYFKQFEKEDKQWHKKWRRITIVFCVGAILIMAIGFFSMAVITSI